jgi:hypothetical protein
MFADGAGGVSGRCAVSKRCLSTRRARRWGRLSASCGTPRPRGMSTRPPPPTHALRSRTPTLLEAHRGSAMPRRPQPRRAAPERSARDPGDDGPREHSWPDRATAGRRRLLRQRSTVVVTRGRCGRRPGGHEAVTTRSDRPRPRGVGLRPAHRRAAPHTGRVAAGGDGVGLRDRRSRHRDPDLRCSAYGRPVSRPVRCDRVQRGQLGAAQRRGGSLGWTV